LNWPRGALHAAAPPHDATHALTTHTHTQYRRTSSLSIISITHSRMARYSGNNDPAQYNTTNTHKHNTHTSHTHWPSLTHNTQPVARSGKLATQRGVSSARPFGNSTGRCVCVCVRACGHLYSPSGRLMARVCARRGRGATHGYGRVLCVVNGRVSRALNWRSQLAVSVWHRTIL
jgi:hypothetical protein